MSAFLKAHRGPVLILVWCAIALLFISLTGCAFRSLYEARAVGNVTCVVNTTDRPAEVVVQSRFPEGTHSKKGTLVRTMRVRTAEPNSRTCFRWPFVADSGRVGLVDRDTVWGEWEHRWERP